LCRRQAQVSAALFQRVFFLLNFAGAVMLAAPAKKEEMKKKK